MAGLSEPADHLHQMERLALFCPIAVVIADAQRRVRFCNPAFQLLFLYQAEEVVGANLEDLIGVGRESETGQAVRRVSSGEHVRQTMRTHRSDGATVEVEFLAVPDMHGGNFNGYCAFFQDITERRRTEKALKASDAKFARAFRASPFAVSLASAKEHRLIDVNDAWVRLFGHRREDAVGRTPLELGLLEDPEDFHRINRQVAAQGGSVRDVECRFRVMDGSSRTGSLSIEEFQTNGEAVRITVISDTTALRNAEATLSRVSLRLIEGQDQERFRIARDLHDDIGQRLALLQFGIDRLKDDAGEPTTDLPAGLDDLWNQAAEISSAVQALSRELHSPALNILRVDKALRNLCADINKRLNMEIDFISHDVPNAVPSDTSVGLFRVLQEALHNAATHSGTRYVEVELWSEPGVLHMKVKDFGTGFPVEATMEHPGLGLVAMRERVALMKGTLSITSTPEVGTEVSVRVPLSAD